MQSEEKTLGKATMTMLRAGNLKRGVASWR